MRITSSLIIFKFIVWLGWILDMLALLCLVLLEAMDVTEEMRRDYMG
jgi:hypothetical protein